MTRAMRSNTLVLRKRDLGHDADARLRLDKWLWYARFFKTRALATAAVAGGRVQVDGARVKPSHTVRIGERLTIGRGAECYAVQVRAIATRRGSGAQAQRLYAETAASLALRARHAQLRKLAVLTSAAPTRRPDKKSRRLIHRFKHGL